MSKTITGQTQIRSIEILAAACHRLGLKAPEHGTRRLYETTHTGHLVFLPNWHLPTVFDLEKGEVHFDNHDGDWGDLKELDRLNQAYATETMLATLRRQGKTALETVRQDGFIELVVSV